MKLPSWITIALVLLLLSINGLGCAKEESKQENPAIGADSATANEPAKLTEVTLQLNWFPEAEHGGYYAAYVHGFYEDAGLNVTIVKGGPGVPVIENVATKRMTFGLSNADQILVGRAAEADVVALFAPIQTSPRCVMVHEKSGIKKFEGLKDMTLAVNQNSTFGAILKRKVPLSGCTIEPYSGSIAKFLLNEDFAQQGYVFSEPFLAKQEGGDPYNLMAADIGFNPYTSVLIAHGETVRNKVDLVKNFVKASKKGWQTYLEDSTETDTHIQQENPEMALQALAFGASELRKLCLTDDVAADKIGHMTRARWQAMFDLMVESGVSKANSVKVDDVFTTEFIK